MDLLKNCKNKAARKDAYLYHAGRKLLKRKPKLIPKLFLLYSSYLLTKRNKLRILDIAITTACPYSCPHCYPDGFYAKHKKPFTTAEIVEIVKQGQKLGIIQFNFQGGEPTLDLERLEKIVSSCNPWSSYITLSSNGYRHSVDELQRIYSMGVDKIAVSLHSGIPEEHDAFVGFRGSYSRVIDLLENAKMVGIEATLGLVVSRDTIHSEGVEKVFELAIKKDIILDVNVAIPVGRWAGQTKVLLEKEDYRYLDEINHNHPNIRRDIHPHLFRYGCPAAKEQLYINVYGDVLACPFLHYSLGNARDSRLHHLRSKAIANKWFQDHYPKCLACEDEEFFEKYMRKVFESEHIPLHWDGAFDSNFDSNKEYGYKALNKDERRWPQQKRNCFTP